MAEENELYAYFTVTADDFDPGELSARVGVSPTESWRRGEVSPRSGQVRRFSRWSLCSRLARDQPLEEHLRDVLSQLDANPEAFRALSLSLGGCMQLVGYFRRGYPGLHFARDITEGLARYSLSVDFDLYWLYSEQDA